MEGVIGRLSSPGGIIGEIGIAVDEVRIVLGAQEARVLAGSRHAHGRDELGDHDERRDRSGWPFQEPAEDRAGVRPVLTKHPRRLDDRAQHGGPVITQ